MILFVSLYLPQTFSSTLFPFHYIEPTNVQPNSTFSTLSLPYDAFFFNDMLPWILCVLDIILNLP